MRNWHRYTRLRRQMYNRAGVLAWPKSFSQLCKVLMNASVLTLIAKGSADKYLTGTPQVSFFKAVFKRHTNFSSFSQEVVMGGATSWGGLARCTLPRQGDLVTDMYISVALPPVTVTGSDPLVRWTDKLGHAMVEFIEVWIGGEMVERHTGEWLELLSQLTQSDEKRRIYYNLIGHKGSLINDQTAIDAQYLYIPLQFWFCRHNGLALPLVALQVHDVDIRVKFRQSQDLLLTYAVDNVISVGPLENVSLFVNYICLDSAERRKFAQMDHAYLIEQVQISDGADVGGTRGNSIDMYFSHPVKELIWVAQRRQASSNTFTLNHDGFPDYNDYFNYSSSATPGEGHNFIDTFLIQINGNNLLDPREANFFNIYNPWRYHTSGPDVGIYCYTFALDPESYQPSGTINWSRLDSATLKCEFNEAAIVPCRLAVYAFGYNILLLKGGMGTLEYQT